MSIAPGFADPVFAAQSTFRRIMDALARPGSLHALPVTLAPPAPLSRGAATVALTLIDQDTPVWLDSPLAASDEVATWLRFHTGAPVVSDPAQAAFALVGEPCALPDFDSFALGTLEYPDRSTTLILQVERFEGGVPLRLRGPGIKDTNTLRASPLPADIAARLAANRALFPRGVDLILVSDAAIAALPRSIHVTEA